ncbi:MAG: NADH-quinone oxidoreductase subunit I [Armatimonadota bacterium]|nr:NADH-quinone oxidoreductase subunit I [Armatimonadota bacterium]
MWSLFKEIIYTPYSVVKGLIVTFVHLFRPKVTLQYPDERVELPENYRGVPSLPVDPKTGTDRCIACGACARICPEQVLTVTSEIGEDKKRKLQEFTIDASRCMWCGLCVEVCPTDALVMSKVYELATDSREGMVFNREDMHRHGGMFPEEPEPEPETSEEQQADNSKEGAQEQS